MLQRGYENNKEPTNLLFCGFFLFNLCKISVIFKYFSISTNFVTTIVDDA